MMMNPILSIVVPTKNRYKYLYHLLRLAEDLDTRCVEVIIQDNSTDNSEILSYLEKYSKPWIKYYYFEKSISMTENCDKAILNSQGEYICFIGDDDGFCLDIIDAVSYMKSHNIDVLLSSKTFYNWPDYSDNSVFDITEALVYRKGNGKLTKINPLKELQKCISNGFDGLYNMPKAYQALVSRSIMNKVWERYNTFFPGPSPDMANAVALSLLNPVSYYWDGPLVYSGQSKSVGGGERLLDNNKLKRLTEVPIMPANVLDRWDMKIPAYWCADSIWPQSAIQALNSYSTHKINYEKILARFIFYHSSYYGECKKLSSNHFILHFEILCLLFRKILAFISHRITYFPTKGKMIGTLYIEKPVKDIKSASRILESYMTFDLK